MRKFLSDPMSGFVSMVLLVSMIAISPLATAQTAPDPPQLTDCERSALRIEGYHDLVCELFAKVLIAEGAVSDANDAYRQAVQRRQDLATEITRLIEINQTRALTQEEAQRLAELLNEQIGAENGVTDTKLALDLAQAKLDFLKSQWQTILRLEREEQAWYDANCTPVPNPNPNPEPDPNFP